MGTYKVLAYLIYLPIAVGLTIYVGKTLFNHGKVFLNGIFNQDLELSTSVNKLLLTGFYLINIGYMVYTMKIIKAIETLPAMIEELSLKVGFIILFLGVFHFFNLFVFFRLKKQHAKHETISYEKD